MIKFDTLYGMMKKPFLSHLFLLNVLMFISWLFIWKLRVGNVDNTCTTNVYNNLKTNDIKK